MSKLRVRTEDQMYNSIRQNEPKQLIRCNTGCRSKSVPAGLGCGLG